MKTLSGLFVYFEKLEWVALDAVDWEINYVCFKGSENARLDLLTEEFPFSNALISDALPMKVIGCRKTSGQDYFAVVGGAPSRYIRKSSSSSALENPGSLQYLHLHSILRAAF